MQDKAVFSLKRNEGPYQVDNKGQKIAQDKEPNQEEVKIKENPSNGS